MTATANQNEGMYLDTVRKKAFNELNEMIYEGILKLQKNELCFCGNKDFIKLSRLDRYGLPFGTQICKKCGLISQTISLTEDSMPIFYDKIYWPLNHGNSINNPFATDLGANEFCNYLIPEIKKRFQKKLKIFEVGCGQGDRLFRLRKELINDFEITIIGCDYSQEAILAAQKNNIIVRKGGVEVLENDSPADIIILSHVFEHVVDIKQFMIEVEKLSHENTLIYIEVPGVTDLINKPEYEYDYQDYCVVAHIHNFSLSTLINVFTTRNYKAIKGSNFVRLIVSKVGEVGALPNKNPFEEIMQSLNDAKEKHEKWVLKYKNPIRVYLANIYKAILRKY
jgi:hypothetical protein